ncbi:MAG: transketolase [Deltaproteobacteria bacterium]|jgi:transketolase|nr:transketolase [Deltaproteobacteria bacterium]
MRKEFATTIENIGLSKENLIFLTGDLGFMALEKVSEVLGKRFVNVGVSEQNMLTLAAAMAAEGLQVICYSIAPFIVFRPTEQIRLDICLHNKNVKIVGNGGGYGYGIMGATHHALEDLAVLSAFQNLRCYIPVCNEDVEQAVNSMLAHEFPSYLRLGVGRLPADWILPAFSPIRNLKKGDGLTIIGMGPVLLNVAEATSKIGDIFAVSELPLLSLTAELKESIQRTGKLLVIEEHVQRGGLGEHLAWQLLQAGIKCCLVHCFAKGYPNGLYGSQKYHQQQSGLDPNSLRETIESL